MIRSDIPIEIQLGITPSQEQTAQQETVVEEAFDPAEIEKFCKESLDFLAATAAPTIFRYFFPPVFKAIWSWLLSYVNRARDFSQLAIGLPRGFGKTMLIKIFVLFCILFTRKQFILIICGTQTKANNIISDICGMLSQQNIRRVFGDWTLGSITDRQDLKRFGFRGRNIILMGAGSGADIRGSTLENERPDVMIFDDIQTREEADSEIVSTNLEVWMYGTAMKAKSPHGCLFIFIANMYPTKWSLLRKIKKNPTWIKFIAGGILSDGTSLWEELQPIKQLLVEYERDLSAGHPEIFIAEVLNDENAQVNNLVNLSKLPPNPYSEDLIHSGNFVIIDPATDKANADAVTLGYFEIFDTIPVATEIVEGRLSPGDICEEAIRLCLRNNCRLIVVESNAFQYVLGWILKQALERYGIQGIQVVDIYSGQKSKVSRILTMFKQLREGEIYFTEQAKPAIYSQITSFNPLRTDNTDGVLDCLTYAPRVLEMYGEFILSGLTVNLQEFGSLPVLTELENSPF